jgi:hypothetical protein
MSTPPGSQPPNDPDRPSWDQPSWDANQGQGYGQPSYGQGGFGYPAAPPPQGSWGQPAQDHPRAILSLILGIVGILCVPITAPFAWVIGKRAVREIDASNGRLGARGMAQAGYILGIVGTVLWVISIIGFVLLVVAGGFAFEMNAGG